jgi:cyclic pyranopterin phosphate synthase
MPEFTFQDPIGRSRVGESSAKEPVHRRAVARCKVRMLEDTANSIATNSISKGDVLGTARVAGIQAAKQTANFIPLCHPLLVQSIFINFRLEENFVEVESQVDTVDRTGVEMEAMLACSVAALTIYDMCKSVDRTMEISDLALWEKSGGSQGSWRRSTDFDEDLNY